MEYVILSVYLWGRYVSSWAHSAERRFTLHTEISLFCKTNLVLYYWLGITSNEWMTRTGDHSTTSRKGNVCGDFIRKYRKNLFFVFLVLWIIQFPNDRRLLRYKNTLEILEKHVIDSTGGIQSINKPRERNTCITSYCTRVASITIVMQTRLSMSIE